MDTAECRSFSLMATVVATGTVTAMELECAPRWVEAVELLRFSSPSSAEMTRTGLNLGLQLALLVLAWRYRS